MINVSRSSNDSPVLWPFVYVFYVDRASIYAMIRPEYIVYAKRPNAESGGWFGHRFEMFLTLKSVFIKLYTCYTHL